MVKRFQTKDNYLIGIISDTHGHLPRSLAQVFDGVDLIIHAGDIGEAHIIMSLESIAPTVAVRGNMDFGPWASQLAAQEVIACNQTRLVVIHDVDRLNLKSGQTAPDVVISGHTHRPLQEENQGILYVNPGSAAYPKYGQPATAALLRLKEGSRRSTIVELTV